MANIIPTTSASGNAPKILNELLTNSGAGGAADIGTVKASSDKANGFIDIIANKKATSFQINDNNSGGRRYNAGLSSTDLSNALVSTHIQGNAPNRLNTDTIAQGGRKFYLFSSTDGSNYRVWYIGGKDDDTNETGLKYIVIDSNVSGSTSDSGTFDNTSVSQMGLGLGASNGGYSSNYTWQHATQFVRVFRSKAGACGIYGSSPSFADYADAVNVVFYGFRELSKDVYAVRVPFKIGDGSTTTTFTDSGSTLVAPKAASNSGLARDVLQANSLPFYLDLTSSDSITLNGTIFIWGVASQFDFNVSSSASVMLNGCTFRGIGGMDVGSSIEGDATFDECGAITLKSTSADLDGSTFKDATGTYALRLAGAMDIADMSFVDASQYGIDVPSAGTYNFSNVSFSGSGTKDIYVSASSGTVTINVSNGGDIPTYNSAGATVVINNNVTVAVTTKTSSGSAISGARVLIEADSGGSLPAGDSVTITRSGTTATVSHAAHGMSDGAYVIIRGANQQEYNGDHQITVVNANSYTYTVSGSPATPATGTITATARILNATTGGAGKASTTFNYSSDQPVKGVARKSSSDPYYKTGVIRGPSRV